MNELMNVSNEISADVLTANQPKPYISFQVDSSESQVKLYNAMNSPEYRVKDMINKPIYLVDAIMVPCTLADESTGEVYDAVRTILIDKDGHTYAATSTGIMSSVRNLFNVFGTLHFDEPVKVVPIEVRVKRGNTLTLKLG